MIKEKVYSQGYHHTHFGDAIATISKVNSLGGGLIHNYNRNIKLILESNLFNIENKIKITNATPNCFFEKKVWSCQFIKSKNKWENKKSNIICFQLEGISLAKAKNPSLKEIEEFLFKIRKIGYEPVKLGLPLSIKKNIEIIVKSKLFVGCDSGMSHLARTTGIPIILTQEKLYIDSMRTRHPYFIKILPNLNKIYEYIKNE